MAQQPMIEITHIGKQYRIGVQKEPYLSLRDEISKLFTPRARRAQAERSSFWALRGVSLSIQQGEAVGIIGANGAGKSTMLKILSRITPPTEGKIILRGRVASLLEVGTGFHGELTGRENIYLNGSVLGMTRREIRRKFDEIVAFAEVEQFIDTPVKRYSSGMFMRLAFAIAAHLDPEILVVDEVLAVGDSNFQKRCLGKMDEVAKGGRTVLFVSHNMGAIKYLCSQCAHIKQGKLVAFGETTPILESYMKDRQEEAERVDIRHRTDRLGTGEVVVTSLALLDAGLQPTPSVGSGDACFLDIGYLAAVPLENLAISWNIRDVYGQPIFRAASDDTGDDCGHFPRIGILRCHIPRLPLIPGNYNMSVHLRICGETTDYVQDAFVLRVEGGDFYGTGKMSQHSPVLLEHRWTLQAEDEEQVRLYG